MIRKETKSDDCHHNGHNHDCVRHQAMHSETVEGLVLILGNRLLISVHVLKGVFTPVVVIVIVLINGLRFKASYRVELLDLSCTEARQRPEHASLDFRDHDKTYFSFLPADNKYQKI